MEKFSTRFIKYWKTYLITFFISLAVCGGVFCLVYFLSGQGLIALSNGLTISGAVLLGCGLLVWITKQGFFDFASYGFKQVGSSLFNRHEPAKYDDYPGYRQMMSEKRKTSPDYWFPIVVVGALVFIAAIVVMIILNTSIY